MSFIFGLILTLIAAILVKYHWSRRKLYLLSWKLHGPITLPIIGNGLEFNCENEDLYDKVLALIRRFKHPMTLWLGPKMFTIFTDLSQVEKLLSSTKLSHKSELYDFIKDYFRAGLVQNSGPEWRSHRKLIMPLMSPKFALNTLVHVNKHCTKMLDQLNIDNTMDIYNTLHCCCFDIVGDTLFGFEVGSQYGKNLDALNAFHALYENVFIQMVKPWLHIPFIFKMTRYSRERDEHRRVLNILADKIIDNSKSRIKNGSDLDDCVIDQIIKANESKPEPMDRQTINDHVCTLYTASEDTLTLISSATCLCLGMYPEYQKFAAEEIRQVFGEETRDVSADDLPHLKYLELCIKEVLRLFPIAPFLPRTSSDDITIGDYMIPRGCDVIIPTDIMHRNTQEWIHPNDFYPDHFLPEIARKRHSYSYIPFSMGPRSCAGMHLAMPYLKVIMANILQRFELEADGKLQDLRFTSYISVRARDGYNVKLKKRSWN